jgi:hypothetical protein
MTLLGTQIGALLAAGALAVGGLLGAASDRPAPRTALVIDAASARHGRALLDPRLRTIDADVRLPRSADEARTDVRYFAARGFNRIVVVGATTTAAARESGVPAQPEGDLDAALAAVGR